MAKNNDRPECGLCGKTMVKNYKAESGKIRWQCTPCGIRTTRPDEIRKGYDEKTVASNCDRLRLKVKSGCKRFIVTALTNNTVKHGKGLESLKSYAKSRKAELVVIPNHYKNKDKYTASQKFKKKFSDGLEQYFIDQNIYIGGGVEIRGDISIEAPAANPLQGKGSIGGERTTIYGHPQQGMLPVGTPGDMFPKRMWSTGCINRADYSRSDRGAKAHHHHIIGALMVEIVGRKHFIRPLHIDSKGGFYDLDTRVDGSKITHGHKSLALITGDEHELFMAKNVRKVVYAKGGALERLSPKYIVRHDVLDGFAGSHHHEKDPLLQFQKHHTGLNDYRKELDRVVDHINKTTPKGCETLMVSSNHHDHLDQWLSRADANKDHTNAILICELQKAVREAVLRGESGAAMPIYLKPRLSVPCRFLSRTAPFLIAGIDVAQHGDKGVNGSRGGPAVFAGTTYKKFTGHTHSAFINKGAWGVGKFCGLMGYEGGYSTHSNTFGIIYPNGKRSLVDIIGNRYHG